MGHTVWWWRYRYSSNKKHLIQGIFNKLCCRRKMYSTILTQESHIIMFSTDKKAKVYKTSLTSVLGSILYLVVSNFQTPSFRIELDWIFCFVLGIFLDLTSWNRPLQMSRFLLNFKQWSHSIVWHTILEINNYISFCYINKCYH